MTDTRSAADPTVRELPLAPGGDLDLRLGANRLRLRVVDADRVVIRGHTDHDLERDVEITSGAGWVRITDGPAGSFRVGPITVRSGGHAPDLDIDVPRGVRISARTLSGDIEAIGVAGPSRWQSASGRVRIGAEAGQLTIETMSGDVQVEARGPIAVTARTVSGGVKVRAPRITALDAATTSGDVTVDAALDAGSSHAVTSVSGDLRLFTGSEVTLDLQSITGDIKASMPHRIDGARGRRTVVVGSGRVRVDVKTMSGDVRLKPGAPDAAPAGSDEASAGAFGPAPRSASWADIGREWAESAKDWASWGASWAAGYAPPAAPSAPSAPEAPAAPPAPPAPEAPSTVEARPSSVPGAEAPAAGDSTGLAAPAAADPDPTVSGPSLEDTAPVPAPGPDDIEAARLEVLRSLERGELDVEAAADRLAALDGAARRQGG